MMQSSKPFYIFVYLPGQLKAIPAARVQFTSDGSLVGSYGNRYHQLNYAIPIDIVSVPLEKKDFILEFGALGAIRDATPDLWGRIVIAKMLKQDVDSLNESDFLLFKNTSRTGNLDFRTSLHEGEPEEQPPFSSDADMLLDASQRIEEGLDADPRHVFLLAQGSSVGGSRPKSTVFHEGALWIAKFPSLHDRWSNARVEMATMQFAKECGIDIPDLRLLDICGRDILLVKRFDREPVSGGFARVAYLSALSLCRMSETAHEAFSYETVADHAIRWGVLDVSSLFKRMAFNVLCRNTDDHPRNHGFLVHESSIVLAPAFDIVPTTSVQGVGTYVTQAMNVGAEGKCGTIANLLSHASRFHLSDMEAKKIVSGMLEQMPRWREFFERFGVKEEEAERFRWSFERWREDPDAQALQASCA